ncbi:a-factor receptor, partial [Serendipita sp. 397]
MASLQSPTPPPDGISVIFPAVPILSVLSIILCLLILPGFWKTRIFAVVYYICWLIAGNGLLLINTCIWRGNVRNIPIYCDIAALFWTAYPKALYMCILCVNKFIWTISKPAPSIRVYDGRKRTNIIDACLCIGFPIVSLPLSVLLSVERYAVIEDIGPWATSFMCIDGFLLHVFPIASASVIIIGFSSLSCYNFWHSGRGQSLPDCDHELQNQHRLLSTSQRWKYTLMSVVTITCTTYGALWVAVPFVRVALEDSIQWYKTVGITSNRLAYQEIAIWTRALLESDGQIMKQHFTGFAYTLPFIGIQLFLFFGLGSEVRKTYVGWFRDFFRLHSNKRSFAWLKGLIGIAIRGATQLGILAGNLKLKRRQLQVDANTFTPFQKEDIVLNDLSAPWHSTIAPPLPSVIPSSAP